MFTTIGDWLFDSAGLTAHGFCLLWEPGLIWTYALSDTVIGLAYFSIPIVLIMVARRRRDLLFKPVLWLFAAFILLCGTTHWLDLLTLWIPVYGVEGVIKAATALVSIFTAVALWWLLPQILALPSRAQLQAASAALLESEERLRQSHKMEAVGQLTGGVAHDFNNLLAGISGALELLERRLKEGRVTGLERYIDAAQTSARRAGALTQRLLAFARRQTLDPKPTNMNSLVAGMEDLIRRTMGPTIAIEVVAAGGLWLTRVDPSQLESSLLNLCINARDAMAPDGGNLTIETANKWLDERAAAERDLPPGQYVSLCVSDSGTGMAPEVIERAFDPFFTTKPLGEGTGLGLSMVYGFARQSGGQVRIYSEIGKGTTVCIYLPRHIGNPNDAETPAELADTRAPGGETVLVIDDEATIRLLIVEVLEDNGYIVLDAADGPSGLKILQSGVRIDLLVTDVGLPGGMNGRQVADAARVARPGLKVLFITGYAENAALRQGNLPVGMELLSKPFIMSALASKIHEMIKK